MKKKVTTLTLAILSTLTMLVVVSTEGRAQSKTYSSFNYTAPTYYFVYPAYYTAPNGLTRWLNYTYDDQYIVYTQKKNSDGTWSSIAQQIIPRAEDGSTNFTFSPSDSYLTGKNSSGASVLYLYPSGDVYSRKSMGGWVSTGDPSPI